MNKLILICVGILTGYKASAADCGKPTIQPVLEDNFLAQDAVAYSWPWQVHLNYLPSKSYLPIQGAALIDSEWIIADADVLGFLNDPKNFKAFLGFNDVTKAEDAETGGVVRDIESIVVHPNYTAGQHDFDVALLKLAGGPVIFSDQVKPVCLLPDDELEAALNSGVVGVATGWQVKPEVEAKVVHPNLQQIRSPVINSTACIALFNDVVGPSAVCSTFETVAIQEYGSPLVVPCGSSQWCLAGLGALIFDWPGDKGIAYGRPFCDFVKQTVGKDVCVSLK